MEQDDTQLFRNACWFGDIKLLKQLIAEDRINAVDVNRMDREGRTALHDACSRAHIEIVKLLVEHGADVIDKGMHCCQTPLAVACCSGAKEIAEYLIDHGAGADKVNNLHTLFDACCSRACPKDIIKLLITRCPVDPKKLTFSEGINRCIRALFNQEERTELFCAMMATDMEMSNNAPNIAITTTTATATITITATKTIHDVPSYASPLYLECQSGHAEIVKSMIEAGAVDVNKPNPGDGNTPLHAACSYGYKEIVTILTKGGASLNETNEDGETPLYEACREGYREIMEFLISCGADVNKADKFGRTPLFQSCHRGVKEAVKILIDGGADVNKADKDGDTPLRIARKEDHIGVTTILVNAGAV